MTSAERTAHGSRPVRAGILAIAPMTPGAFAFGVAFGALVVPAGLNPLTGVLASTVISAGAAQISIVNQLTAGVPAVIAALTAIAINLRFALYSAALAPLLSGFPPRLKTLIAFRIADPAVPIALHQGPLWEPGRPRQRFVGAVFATLWTIWMTGTIVGVIAGPVIPPTWGVAFIVPLMFAAVIVPGIRTAPELVAALVGLTAVVLLRDMPLGLNVVTAGVLGVAAGMLVPGTAGPRPESLEMDEEPEAALGDASDADRGDDPDDTTEAAR